VAVTITGDRAVNGLVSLRATIAVAWNLGLYGLIEMTDHQVPQQDLNPRRKDHRAFTPLRHAGYQY
jgi:hypothetical protein